MFTWTQADARRSRAYTCKLLDMAEEGLIDWETLARDALNWMSEEEVATFARRNDYIQTDPDEDLEEEDEDGMTMEDRARRDGRGGDE